MSLFIAKSAPDALPNHDGVCNPMLAATTSMNGRLGADNTDAVALFAQLMSTLAGNIAPTIELVDDPRVPTLPGSTFAAIVLLFHCREKLKQCQNKIICCAL